MEGLHKDDQIYDYELVEQMRTTNSGTVQLDTLCRMHLSFLSFQIDLEPDSECSDRKNKLWNKFHKKTKACTASNSSPYHATALSFDCEGITKLIDFLKLEENIIQEGIFRKTGSVARQSELKTALVEDSTLDLVEGIYTAHDCASVLKTILGEMEEPLVTLTYYSAFQQVAELYNGKSDCPMRDDRLLNSLQLLFILIPKENRLLLLQIIKLLHSTIEHEVKNKMNADNLSTLFTPHLACPRNLPSESLMEHCKAMYGIVSFMIKKGELVFQIPIKLATDIRAYFVEQKRRKTLSPEQILNESVASETTANTVFTFVDHKRTAEAQTTTDTALAELYAYIQSLPETTKKKKLIKQFNKENGHGTPLQLLNTRKDKISSGLLAKTIGSSIKKHIFTKGFLSKTPKRTDTPVSSLSQTPNKTNVLPTQRNLFAIICDTPSTSTSIVTNALLSEDKLASDNTGLDELTDLSVLTNLHPSKRIYSRSLSETRLNRELHIPGVSTRSLSVGDIPHNVNTVPQYCIPTEIESTHESPKCINISFVNNMILNHDQSLDSSGPGKIIGDNCTTPGFYLGRQSMSPITKSTKRMPKSMQESIMTPRSRKPITAIESITDSKSMGFECLLEESELNSPVPISNVLYQLDGARTCLEHYSIEQVLNENPDQLSETFKKYLMNGNALPHRNLMPPPADDDSFSSQPGDFVSSTDLKDMSEEDMSESFLYCMDGNDPDTLTSNSDLENNDKKRILAEQNNQEFGSYEPQKKKLYLASSSGASTI